jgi:integrase
MARRRSTRRGRGEGSVFEQPNGTWRGKVTVGYTEKGKQRFRWVSGKTQAEALAKVAELKQQLVSGTLSDTKLTVKQYLESWLKEKERQVKARTAFDYRYNLEKYIYPGIGYIKLEKLTPLQVQRFLSEVADAVSPDRANKCRRELLGVLKQAVRWGLIPRNPVDAVAPLKHERREMVLWTAHQAAAFLQRARAHRLYALFYVAMSTGLRSGELIGLRWQDVKGDKLIIRQNFVKVGAALLKETPKSKKGNRVVAISPDVLEVLSVHRATQETERQPSWPEDDLVFVSEVGTPLNPDNLRRLRNSLMDGAKVPRVRLHDLRHLHASVAIKSGVDPKVLADRLGHARASFTLDVYTHLFEEQRASSAVSLLDFLPKEDTSKEG